LVTNCIVWLWHLYAFMTFPGNPTEVAYSNSNNTFTYTDTFGNTYIYIWIYVFSMLLALMQHPKAI